MQPAYLHRILNKQACSLNPRTIIFRFYIKHAAIHVPVILEHYLWILECMPVRRNEFSSATLYFIIFPSSEITWDFSYWESWIDASVGQFRVGFWHRSQLYYCPDKTGLLIVYFKRLTVKSDIDWPVGIFVRRRSASWPQHVRLVRRVRLAPANPVLWSDSTAESTHAIRIYWQSWEKASRLIDVISERRQVDWRCVASSGG